METPENQFKRALNPWFSIWTKPRDTMKEIFISKPKNVFFTHFTRLIRTDFRSSIF